MQLAHAIRADQLIPGDPAQVKLLQRLVVGFAEAAYDTRWLMKDTSLGGWTGAAAQAVEAELIQVREKLTKAEEVFGDAAGALTGYYTVHADAQAEAAEAVKLWQSAILASQVARGVAVGPAPAGAPADPDAVLARAAALSQDAVERLRLAGKTLAEVLHELKEGAPKDPGFWAKIRRGVASFASGLFEGTVTEPIEGVVGIAKLAVALDPARAIYDPDGYGAAQEALYAGIGHVLTHPGEFGAQLIDVKGWQEDPIKTFGKFLPDLLAIGAAVKAGGLLKGGEATERVESGTAAIKKAEHDFESVYGAADPAKIREVVEARGIDPSSAVGEAMRFQMEPPYGGLDDWRAIRLEPKQRIAVIDNGRAIVPFHGELPTDARQFTEQIHLPPARQILKDNAGVETTTMPRLPGKVEIYEVRSHIDAAEATMQANTQFGAGGGSQLIVPDATDALADERLFKKLDEKTHYFDKNTLDSRIEDPAYRAVDPAYQDLDPHARVRALDPGRETWVGRFEGLRDKAVETVRDNAQSAVAVATKDRMDEDQE
jgi:hypothetical protein